jgi:hypothetical protein
MTTDLHRLSSASLRHTWLWALVLSAAILASAPARAGEGDDLLRDVDRRLQPETYEAYRKLINIEPDGSRKEFVLFTLKKGPEKVAALFLSPASEKSRATLRLGENVWLYIPGVGKPLRITSLQSVTGGVFNNSDILRVDYTSEYDVVAVEKKPDATHLALKAKSGSVAYDRLEMVVDPKALVPRTIRCFAASGMLIKTLELKQMKDFGGGLVRPSVIETTSPLQKGYRSVMVFAKISSRQLADEVFTLGWLSKLEELR